MNPMINVSTLTIRINKLQVWLDMNQINTQGDIELYATSSIDRRFRLLLPVPLHLPQNQVSGYP